jgi:hypothetical protein
MEKGAVWLLIISQLCIWGYVWWKKRRTRKLIQGEPERRGGTQKQSREMKELAEMRKRSLNTPLSEKARPAKMNEVIGQEEGIRALRAAMCGPNPQHVIIYGPPGCGKTCAARLVLEEARRQKDSPFDKNSKFVEVDATCVRFDERAIAAPLMGSVHDPIYQGAGALGSAGVPQPKPGAVSRAHCGILFLDEIGELHPVQMNKLLKVLEDNNLEFHSVSRAAPHAFLSVEHPLAKRESVTPEELMDYPCIVYEQDGDSPGFFSEEMMLPNFYPRKVVYISDLYVSTALMRGCNAYDIGTGVISKRLSREVACVPIATDDRVDIGWIGIRDRALRPIERSFLDCMTRQLHAAQG